MGKSKPKLFVSATLTILGAPFVPILAIGWWIVSEDTYWQSVKKVFWL